MLILTGKITCLNCLWKSYVPREIKQLIPNHVFKADGLCRYLSTCKPDVFHVEQLTSTETLYRNMDFHR